MLRRISGLAVVVVVCCGSFGFSAEAASPIVSPQLLEHAQMDLVWQNRLPISKAERIERLLVLDDSVYVLTNRNYLFSVNKERGSIRFGTVVAAPGFTVFGPQLFADELLLVTGNRLLQMDPEFGTITKSEAMSFSASCAAERNSMYIYVAGTDRRLHVLRAVDKVQVFETSADNDSLITSVSARENSVIFTTEVGNVVSISSSKPELLWQFDAVRKISAPVAQTQNWVFVSSQDTNIYKVNTVTGQLGWEFRTGAVLIDSAQVTGGVVYQYARDKGLYAIDKESGDLLWLLQQGRELLAEVNDKAYVITIDGRVVVMDNKAKKQLYSVNFAGVERYAANTADSRIYVADEAGRLGCIELKQK